jgi:hypothetical protein
VRNDPRTPYVSDERFFSRRDSVSQVPCAKVNAEDQEQLHLDPGSRYYLERRMSDPLGGIFGTRVRGIDYDTDGHTAYSRHELILDLTPHQATFEMRRSNWSGGVRGISQNCP